VARTGAGEGDGELGHGWSSRAFGGRPHRRPHQEQDLLLAGKLDFAPHLAAVEGTKHDQPLGRGPKAEDVAGEAEAELGSHGRPVAHAVHRESQERDQRPALGDQRLERLLVDVVLELLLLDWDGDDLVDPLDADRVGEPCRILRDHRDRDRAVELLRRGDQLQRHLAELPAKVLGHHEHAHAPFLPSVGKWLEESFTPVAP
jgi:hypothetical protein